MLKSGICHNLKVMTNPIVITPAVSWNGTYWELSLIGIVKDKMFCIGTGVQTMVGK